MNPEPPYNQEAGSCTVDTMNTQTFNEELAQRITERLDRDAAPFFAGRAREIESFETALRNASESTAAVFCIYQGPPGCGKTSLAAHLEGRHNEENVLFVRPSAADMESIETLVLAAAGQTPGAAASVAGDLLGNISQAGAGLTQVLASQARQVLAAWAKRNTQLVIHIDEAQKRVGDYADTLLALHTEGLRQGSRATPCVVLLTGLENITDDIGISRLAYNSIIRMGGLAGDECAESTSKMLSALRVHGTSEEKARLARLTAELSSGWPAHLSAAQQSLCEALLRNRGEAALVDTQWMVRTTMTRRAGYYESRIQHPPLDSNSVLTCRMLVEIALNQNIRTRHDLWEACADIIEEYGPKGRFPMDPVQGKAFGEAFRQRGLTTESEGRIQLAIPSMGDWAGRKAAGALHLDAGLRPDDGAEDEPPAPA